MRVLIVVAALLAAVLPMPALRAQEPAVSNVFIETDLRQALGDVAAQTGVNIIAEPSVQGVVTVDLKEVSIDRALTLLLAGTGYQSLRTADFYLVFDPDESALGFTDVAATERIAVRHVPAPVARSLLPPPLQRYVRVDETSDALAVTAPPALLDRIRADLAILDVPTSSETLFIPLHYARAGAVHRLLSPSLQRYVRTDEERNMLAITAPDEALAAILDQVDRIDRARPPGNFDMPDVHPTVVVKLNHAEAPAVLALLPPSLQNYVRADAQSNTLAVSAPDELADGIVADILAIDTPRKRVLLDARVVALERGDLLDFGADWEWPTVTAGAAIGAAAGAAVGMPWMLRIGYSPDGELTDALSLTLNLLSQNNEATILASPQVQAQDGKPAEIKVTTEEYFQITSEAAGGAFLRNDLQQIETGTILTVTPRIGRNNEIALDIDIEVSDVVARGAQNLPVISRRTAKSNVHLRNGGTAVVAGLVDTRSQVGRSGVPGSHSLPLLGRAFRTDTLNHQARQVAIFITATVVEPGSVEASTGRRRPPPVVTNDDDAFRLELEAALDRLARQ